MERLRVGEWSSVISPFQVDVCLFIRLAGSETKFIGYLDLATINNHLSIGKMPESFWIYIKKIDHAWGEDIFLHGETLKRSIGN
jgi:hypothetical protein